MSFYQAWIFFPTSVLPLPFNPPCLPLLPRPPLQFCFFTFTLLPPLLSPYCFSSFLFCLASPSLPMHFLILFSSAYPPLPKSSPTTFDSFPISELSPLLSFTFLYLPSAHVLPLPFHPLCFTSPLPHPSLYFHLPLQLISTPGYTPLFYRLPSCFSPLLTLLPITLSLNLPSYSVTSPPHFTSPLNLTPAFNKSISPACTQLTVISSHRSWSCKTGLAGLLPVLSTHAVSPS